MKHNDIEIGQTVYHNFSNTKGVVSGKRLKKPYTICVFWEDGSFREDWYKPEVLTNVEGERLMSKEYDSFKSKTIEATTHIEKANDMEAVSDDFAEGFRKAMWEAREIYMRVEDEEQN